MAAVKNHGDVRIVFCKFGKKDRQFLVGQIESTLFSAVETDKTFIHSIRIELLESVCRFAASAMATILKHCDVIRLRLPQVQTELVNNIGASRIPILQDFDMKTTVVEIVL